MRRQTLRGAECIHQELRAIRGDDLALADRCLGALLDFADREGKRLVLMVENVNERLPHAPTAQ